MMMSKYLSYHQRNAIHTAVSAHPQAKPTEVWCNLKNFSPSKHVSDTTFKICDRDLNKLTLGLNSLGAHYHPLSVNIIQGNAESAIMYRNAWNSVRKAAHAKLSDLKSCPMAGCELCTTIEKIKSEKRMKAFLKLKIGKEVQ